MGSDATTNLCLCCLRCNLKKGPNIASTDPEVESEYRIVALFHPRKQRWPEHFLLREDGRIGGVTLDLLSSLDNSFLSDNLTR
jgi:hypothetical protein